MTEINCCNSINHPFSLPTIMKKHLIPNFLTPQNVNNIKDREGNTPLHFAVSTDDLHLVNLLLNSGALVNEARMDGCTPLHIAVQSAKEENVQMLLDFGARVNVKELFGKTPLHIATYANYQNYKKIIGIGKLLLDRGIDAKSQLNECTDSGETALHYAVIHGNKELVQLFLQYGANVNAKNRDGKSPLYFAIEYGYTKIAKFLLRNGARVNDKMNHGLTALHEAVKQREDKSVELLLNYGAEVNAKDIYGETPLHLAARLYYLDERKMDTIVVHLLNKGADVNYFMNSGETAFHCAIINGHEKLVKLLLEYGCKINVKNFEGKSALHLAIQYSNKNIVKLLLDRGANIDDQTNDGKLSLHMAVAIEDENMLKILLDYNANVNAIDKSGKTPLTLAFEMAYMRNIYNPWNGFCPMHSEVGSNDNIFEILIKHIAKLTNVCEENLKMIRNNEKLNHFYESCQAELIRMKSDKICDNITMYKVLTKDMNAILGYSRNEKLLQIFETDLYANKFPIYYHILKKRFYKAENRKQLLQPSLSTFGLLVKPFSLPDLVTYKILSYLTNEDLMNLKKIWKFGHKAL